jgi:hypothetical protein
LDAVVEVAGLHERLCVRRRAAVCIVEEETHGFREEGREEVKVYV